jgi:ABC-type glycerol-3-phosphate transport system permease component
MKEKIKRKLDLKQIIVIILVAIAALAYFFPVFWMLLTSFRPIEDIYAKFPPPIIPGSLSFDNYIYVFTKVHGFFNYVINSIVITFSTVGIVVISSIMGGYAFGMRKFKGQNTIFMFILLVLTIPYIMYLIPIFMMEDFFHLRNSWLGLILPYVALNLPWGLLIMRGAFSAIPLDLKDAAVIDGCGEFKFVFRILTPILKPSLAATTIITYVFAWEEFLFASTLMSKNEWQTLPVGIVWVRDELQTLVIGRIGAMVVVTVIPVLILFFIFRNFFIKGLSEGMLKG